MVFSYLAYYFHCICSYRILTCFSSKNVWSLIKAYVTYIRPKLEYNTSVWFPYLKRDIRSVESVQKNFTQKVCARCNIPFDSYTDRLSKLNLKFLEYRRMEFDLILTYKICYRLIYINFDDVFSCTEPSLRRNSFILRCKNKPNRNAYRYFFSNRVISVWNSLPESIISSTVNGFKNA